MPLRSMQHQALRRQTSRAVQKQDMTLPTRLNVVYHQDTIGRSTRVDHRWNIQPFQIKANMMFITNPQPPIDAVRKQEKIF